jgi:hypothetical protein
MSLLSIPNELIVEIGDYLTSPADLNNLVCTNRVFYRLLNERLYKRTPSRKALLHTIRHNRISTMQRFIDGGLDVDMPIPATLLFDRNTRCRNLGCRHSVMLLRYAVFEAALDMIRILLEAGASAKMCYMNRHTAMTDIGKLLLHFGATLVYTSPACNPLHRPHQHVEE